MTSPDMGRIVAFSRGPVGTAIPPQSRCVAFRRRVDGSKDFGS